MARYLNLCAIADLSEKLRIQMILGTIAVGRQENLGIWVDQVKRGSCNSDMDP